MNRFGRQENIVGWDQANLAQSVVSVLGRGWLGTFLVWALCSLGVGKVLWFGRSRPETQRMADWLLAYPCPFEGSSIQDCPYDLAYEPMLDWAIAGNEGTTYVLVDCAEDCRVTEVSQRFIDRRGAIRWFAGGVSGGGWLSAGGSFGEQREGAANPQEPIVALAVAALLADAVRSFLCPLPSDLPATYGDIGWEFPHRACTAHSQDLAVLVGVGGIGVYAATLLATCGHASLLIDFDHVEESNRNRQGLFTPGDALNRSDKAFAARQALGRFFPQAQVLSSVQRVDSSFRTTLQKMRPHPAVLLSAVDNARTRIVLQQLGDQLGLPVVQSGTDLFGADCFTQVSGGPLLDEQMHGVLSDSASREDQAAKRHAGCAVDPSYVVPGMIAGAMLVRRFELLLAGGKKVQSWPPLRWRQGMLPCERENPNHDTVDL
jgi:tRNA A37 threonylcarbamoyladenosine dehydratase